MGILTTVASQEGHVEVVKALLAQSNINVNQARTDLEWKGISPFWIASFNRHAEVVKELLKKSEIKVNQAQNSAKNVNSNFQGCHT